MKKWLCLLVAGIMLLLLPACKKEPVVSDQKPTNTQTPNAGDAVAVYNGFLSGKCRAVGQQGTESSIDEYINANQESTANRYAVYDMNGDTIPELIIKTPWRFVIFSLKENRVTLWHENAVYCRPLNNGAILYERHGGGPTHITYQYIVLDHQGNEVYKIQFAEYEATEQESTVLPQGYFVNNADVSEEAYKAITAAIKDISDDKIHWQELKNNG